jgi:hypothetical protein
MGKRLNSGRKVGSGRAESSKPTQFVKGKSGNPNGREKGVRNLATEIEEELNIRIPITENGTRKNITKRKAIAKQLVNKAATGDPKAIPVLLNQTRLQEARSATGPAPDVLSQSEDELVMANIVKRIREAEITPPDPPAKPGTDDPSTNTSQPEAGDTP